MTHDLSIATDYATDQDCPEPYLRRIAQAGFRYIHWCHHWSGDFLYGPAEIDQIARWLDELGLRVLDLHGSAGKEKVWLSAVEYQRLAGIELVANRVEMAHRLGCDVVVMHAPPPGPDDSATYWARFGESLDAVRNHAQRRGVRIALENLPKDNFDALERAFALYGPEFLGLCYDSGHGNMTGNGLDRLERVKDRLIALHLHDNDGTADQHKLPMTGTIDWDRLAHIIAESSYDKPAMTMESGSRSHPEIADEDEFLRRAAAVAEQFAAQVAAARGAQRSGR